MNNSFFVNMIPDPATLARRSTCNESCNLDDSDIYSEEQPDIDSINVAPTSAKKTRNDAKDLKNKLIL